MNTFQEVLEKLANYDQPDICELLDISSEELVEAFQDKLEARYSYIVSQIE